MKAKVKVKVTTKDGYWSLKEIKGLEEGTIITGIYKPKNKSFSFIFKGERAILWINKNAELIEIIEEPLTGKVIVSVAICKNEKVIAEKDTIKEARRYAKENELENVEYWYLASEIINEKGDINIPCWGRTRNEALEKLRKLIGNFKLCKTYK